VRGTCKSSRAASKVRYSTVAPAWSPLSFATKLHISDNKDNDSDHTASCQRETKGSGPSSSATTSLIPEATFHRFSASAEAIYPACRLSVRSTALHSLLEPANSKHSEPKRPQSAVCIPPSSPFFHPLPDKLRVDHLNRIIATPHGLSCLTRPARTFLHY